MMSTVPIAEMRNLGPRSQSWLSEIGVRDSGEVRRLGAVEIYRRLKLAGLPASLNLVYAIEASIMDLDWRELPPAVKAELKAAISVL